MATVNMINANLAYCSNAPAATIISDTFTSNNYNLTNGVNIPAYLATLDGSTTSFVSIDYPPNNFRLYGYFANNGTAITRVLSTGGVTNGVTVNTTSATQVRFFSMPTLNTNAPTPTTFGSANTTGVGGLPTMTAGSGVATATITNSFPNYTFNAPTYSAVIATTSASNTFSVQRMNQCQGAALQTAALPATSAVGDVIWITNSDATSTNRYKITQAAGQYIRIGSSISTVGTGGYIQSNGANVSVHLICTEANLGWAAIGSPTSPGFTVV